MEKAPKKYPSLKEVSLATLPTPPDYVLHVGPRVVPVDADERHDAAADAGHQLAVHLDAARHHALHHRLHGQAHLLLLGANHDLKE